jgi:hypothetical protein
MLINLPCDRHVRTGFSFDPLWVRRGWTYNAPRARITPTETLALRLSCTFQRRGIGIKAQNQSVAMLTAVVA